MVVIGFFRDLISSLSGLMYFISTPLGDQFEAINIEPLKSMSIMGLLGVGLVTTLGVILTFRFIRLFVGG